MPTHPPRPAPGLQDPFVNMAPPKASKKKELVFKLDCTTPVEDKVMQASALEDYLRGKIKVDNKCGNLGDLVRLASSKTHVTISSDLPISKKYLKYLTKKFLKKYGARDWVRVIAGNKDSYKVRRPPALAPPAARLAWRE